MSLMARWAVPADVEEEAAAFVVELALADRQQQRRAMAELNDALDERALDEDRAIALARLHHEARSRRAARVIMGRSLREASAPWRSLSLMADWESESESYEGAARLLEEAMIHSAGALEVRRRLFVVRRALGQHRAALCAVGVDGDRPAGVAMLSGLEDEDAATLAGEIADSAMQVESWAVAEAYANEALHRIDAASAPERAHQEHERIRVIHEHLSDAAALERQRPWIRRGR